MTKFVCAIDLGTSSAKVGIADDQGRMERTVVAPYRVDSPKPRFAETSPICWWEAILPAIREALSGMDGELVGVGIDGQMHGLVLHDFGRPVRPAILWADGRANEQAQRWRSLPEELVAPLANPIVPGMFGPVLDWLCEHEPESVSKANHACSPKDWITGQLIGKYGVSDASDSSATLLWDVPGHRWHQPLLDVLGLPSRLLPSIMDSSAQAGTTLSGLGVLPAGLPVSVGCGDTAGTLVASQLDQDEVLVNLGTGIQVCQVGGTPVADAAPKCHTYADAQGGWYSMVAPQNGGLVLGRLLEWLGATWDELYASLDAPARRDEPTFRPWAAPERLPRLRDGNQAGWVGLGLQTQRTDLLRASLEAVAFQIAEAIDSLPRKPSVIRFAGGGNRDQRMRQLICDAVGLPGRMSTIKDATTLGAARLGFTAAGIAVDWPIPREPSLTEPRVDRELDRLAERYRAESASGP